MGKYINEETGMDYWGGPDEYEEFFTVYELEDEMFIEKESRVHPYTGKYSRCLESFRTLEEAEFYIATHSK